MSGLGWQELLMSFVIVCVPLWVCPVSVVWWATKRQNGEAAVGWTVATMLSVWCAWLVVLAWFLVGRAPSRTKMW